MNLQIAGFMLRGAIALADASGSLSIAVRLSDVPSAKTGLVPQSRDWRTISLEPLRSDR